MTPPLRTAVIRITLVTLSLGAVATFLKHTHTGWYLPGFPLMLLVFAGIYLLFCQALLPPRITSQKQFINRFILFTGIKLLLLMALVITWLLTHKENRELFLAYVMILYAGYSLASYSVILPKKNYDI